VENDFTVFNDILKVSLLILR